MQNTADWSPFTSAAVAIPVRDEAERIQDCLAALSQMSGPAPGIVLFVNNTTDGTLRAITDVASLLQGPLVVIERTFPACDAHAGTARRAAMEVADEIAPIGVPLLTTDADGRVPPDWLTANLAHLRDGADAVFGRAEIDPSEALHIPPALHAADAQECAYAAMLDHIEHLLDPDPVDPWPRHTEHSGASIAVRRCAYRDAGGVPAVPLGEDRAFHLALRRIGARIRHAPDVSVVVSGRILGRAAGGMADTIRRRLVSPDTMLDPSLELVAARVRRLRIRKAARAAFLAGRRDLWIGLAVSHGTTAGSASAAFEHRPFGSAWEQLDAGFPCAPVSVQALPEEMLRAVAVRDLLLGRVDQDASPLADDMALMPAVHSS